MLPFYIDPFLSMMLTAKQRRCLQVESEGGLAPCWFENWQECEPLDKSFDLWAKHVGEMADGFGGESGDLSSADDAVGGAGDGDIDGGGGAPNSGAQLLLKPIPSE